MHTANGTYV